MNQARLRATGNKQSKDGIANNCIFIQLFLDSFEASLWSCFERAKEWQLISKKRVIPLLIKITV